VLVAIGLADTGTAAASAAALRAPAAGATLHTPFVAPAGTGQSSARDPAAAGADLITMLGRAGVRAAPERTHVLDGDPAVAIGLLADRIHADVIVLGRHASRPRPKRVLGGTALAVVTNASCPCLVISGGLELPLCNVLVPVDLSDTARGALLVGLSWASALRPPGLESAGTSEATLTALHVQAARPAGAEPAQPNAIDRELRYIREQAGTWAAITIDSETLANADPARGIAEFVAARKPDLVVMGTRGLGLDPIGRIGSVTATVVETLEVPMLLVPPAVWTAHAAKP
jgi:nucleotide-binding universal stress UspA family protein